MTMKKADKNLRTHVLDELDWDPSIEADNIGVAVSEGVVTLSGEVPSYPQKRAAERAALRVEGVEGIANDLKVRLPDDHEHTDTDIAKAAHRAIEWHSQLPSEKITVKVEEGWITLQGTVNWYYQAARAEEAVRHLLGVRGVRNELVVEKKRALEDTRQQIRRALERQVGRDIERLRIHVDDGVVTLKGTVDAWADRENIERAAWAAPGVREVHNNLNVEANHAY